MTSAGAADDEEGVAGLNDLLDRVGLRFARAEPRRRARVFVRGMLSQLERKNGWTLAEYAGDRSPNGMQRLLNAARWDVDGVRDDLRDWVVEQLGGHGVLVPGETRFAKRGDRSVGVQARRDVAAGSVASTQLGLFLAYAAPGGGRALIDRELYLPESWAEDRQRCRAAGVPDGVGYATRHELVSRMIQRAVDAKVPVRWVAADSAYGADPAWRAWLEERGLAYVVATHQSDMVTTWRGQVRDVAHLAAVLPHSAWERRPGPHDQPTGRLGSAWARIALAPAPADRNGRNWERLLLVRRSAAGATYYHCHAPAGVALPDLVRVARAVRAAERCLDDARHDLGLDQYQVRRYDAWYRHMTLSLLAAAHLAVVRAGAAPPDALGDLP
jgi:SRSO17 transposase